LQISINQSYNIIVLFHQREESDPEDIKEPKVINQKVINQKVINQKVINQEQEDIIKNKY
jgi:hypothetical protein